MFSRRKQESKPKEARKHDLSQFGITEINNDFDPTLVPDGDNDDDSDLEAELAAIAGGITKGTTRPKPKPKIVPQSDLDRMISDSMRDVGSDEDLSGDDEHDDNDLLAELQNIAGGELIADDDINDDNGIGTMDTSTATVMPASTETNDGPPQLLLPTTTVDAISIIKQRIEMYKQAELIAKAGSESAKVRRFSRGLKALKELLKQASAGKEINIDDIPPEVSIKPLKSANNADSVQEENANGPNVPVRIAPPLPSPVSPSVPTSPVSPSAPTSPVSTSPADVGAEDDSSIAHPTDNGHTTEATTTPAQTANLEILKARQREYKTAALNCKRSGDTTNALQFLKVVKQFEMVIKLCEEGNEVDLSDMPPPPEQFLEFMAKMQAAAAAEGESIASVEVPPASLPSIPDPNETQSSPAVTSTSMLDALQQRLDKYRSVQEAAKNEGNSSKVRRFGRIVKQYEDAIKQYKSGSSVEYEELPVPPGFGPLPINGTNVDTTNTAATPTNLPNSTTTTTAAAADQQPSEQAKAPAKHDLTTRTSGNQQTNNLAEQQMKILLERQKEFKLAAIEAKKAGEIDQAKEYLKIFKGFDALLNAASSGLPVDLNTLPVPPSQRDNLEASFAIVTTDDCDPNDDISDISVRIEEQLAKQLMMCKNTRDHHKAMGDIAGMNRFENLALTVQKDLDLVRYSKRKNFPLPKFHYEKKSFNIVHCNTELTDNELEIVVVRGLNYNVANPKDVDTYVRIECPLLNDEVFKAKTTLVKDNDSPDYDQRFIVEIQRNSRQFQRIFRRHGVKFEVYSRGGFLRSDILIGAVNVKLQALETKCDIHDTFNLMEGRKTIGGKLEIKLRLRNPLLTKQIEHLNEKWLILDT